MLFFPGAAGSEGKVVRGWEGVRVWAGVLAVWERGV